MMHSARVDAEPGGVVLMRHQELAGVVAEHAMRGRSAARVGRRRRRLLVMLGLAMHLSSLLKSSTARLEVEAASPI